MNSEKSNATVGNTHKLHLDPLKVYPFLNIPSRPVEHFYWNVLYSYRRFLVFCITCYYRCMLVIIVSLNLIVITHWCFTKPVHMKGGRLRNVV